MITLRNSVKAIIIKNNKMLFVKNRAKESGEIYYILPGGGQNGGETFVDAVKRECNEELGAEIEVGELQLVREYIGKNHEFAYKSADFHQIEYMFSCRLKTSVDMSKTTCVDPDQTGFEWIKLAEMKEKNIHPKILKSVFDNKGAIAGPVYLGDVN